MSHHPVPPPDAVADDDEARQLPRRPAIRRQATLVLKLFLGAVVLALAYRLATGIDWPDLTARLGDIDRPLAALAIAFLVGRNLVWQLRWGRILTRMDTATRWLWRFGAVSAAVAINHVTPYLRVFGGILKARYVARRGQGSFARHYGGVLFEQLIHGLVLGVLLWLTGSVLAWVYGRRWLAVAALVAGGALLGYLFHRRSGGVRSASPLIEMATHKARTQAHRFKPLARHGRELVEVLRELFGDDRLVLSVAFWSLVFGALNIGAQWLVFRALGIEVGVLTVIAVVGGGVLVGVVTGSPGGVATTEAAMTAGYMALGLAATDAAAATLVYRGLHYAAVLGCGLPSMLWFEIAAGPSPAITGPDPSDGSDRPATGSPDAGEPPHRAG